MELILPALEHMQSFLEMAKSLESEAHWWGPHPKEIQQDFPAYLSKLAQARSGQKIEPDEISKTEFWILDNGLIAGRINLNHELSEGMKIRGGHIGYGISKPFRKKGLASLALAKVLEFAKQKGMKDILMTCDEDNIGSFRVIERNGGKFKDQVFAPGRSIVTRRYTISL